MILIAGDSWGCGEWPFTDRPPKIFNSRLMRPCHKGLEQFLIDNQKKVVNISFGGATPRGIIQRITKQCTASFALKVSRMFVFQTEWTRDYDPKSTPFSTTLAEEMILQWYKDLSTLSLKYNFPVYLIGGCSDVMRVNNFDEKFPGLAIACQSMTNLLVNHNHEITQPVFCVRPEEWRIGDIKRSIAHTSENDKMQSLVNLVESGQHRDQIWKDNPQWFWPDGVHANRHGHGKLYNFLQEREYFD